MAIHDQRGPYQTASPVSVELDDSERYAKFSIRFEGNSTPRKVGIRSGNQATFGRDEDSLIIEEWITDQQLVKPRTPKPEAAPYVEKALESATA